MTDFAELIMDVDSSGLKRGGLELDILAAKGAKAETRVTKSTKSMSEGIRDVGSSASRMGPHIQAAGYQVGDFFVQIASGTDASRALAQQLPQLLGAFGAVGAVAGAAVAVVGALAPVLMSGGKEAEDFADIMEDLAKAMDSYKESTEEAHSSTIDLIEKFGFAAPRAREMYEALALMSRLDAIDKIADGLNRVIPAFSDVTSLVRQYDAEINDANAMIREGAVQAADDLKESFGLTVDQARRLADAVDAAKLAEGPKETAKASREVVAALIDAQRAGADLPPELRVAVTEAARLTISADQLTAILSTAPGYISDATGQTVAWAGSLSGVLGWLNAIGGVLSNIGGGMINYASQATEIRLLKEGKSLQDAAIGAARERARLESKEIVAGMGIQNELLRKGAELAINASKQAAISQGEELAGLQKIAREREAAATKAAGGGGRKGRKAGGGSGERLNGYERSVHDIQSQTEAFLRQADAMAKVVAAGGDWEHAVAVIEEEQKLLNAAQKAGVELTPEIREGIKGMAEDYVNAEEQLERIRTATEKGQDVMKDFFGSMLDGADAAKEALANLLSEIAKVQFAKGMLGLIGGTSWGSSLIEGIGDLSSWDGGGYTWDGSRTGGVDGKGGRVGILHPNETVIDHTKGQSAAANVHVTVGIDQSGNLYVRQIAQQEAASMGKAVSASIKPTVQQYQVNPRKNR